MSTPNINFDLAYLLTAIPQALFYLLVSPLVIGMLRWMKARLVGRQGPSPFQPYQDLWKLIRQVPIIPETASWVFISAPLVVFSCFVVLGILSPIVYVPLPEGPIIDLSNSSMADLLVIFYILALSRFVMGLAGMDAGLPFGGMGSGRELFKNVLTEPTLLVLTFGLALNTNTTSLTNIFLNQSRTAFLDLVLNPPLWLIFLSFTIIIVIETGRIPIDNPATHLELTMIEKAIHLEYGGVYLALLKWSDAMRLTFLITLLLNLFMPYTLATEERTFGLNILLILIYPLKLIVIVAVLAFWEVTRVKLKLRSIVFPAAIALLLAVMSIFLTVVISGYPSQMR